MEKNPITTSTTTNTSNSDFKYRFNIKDEENWRKHLKEEGFVVLSEVITEQDCKTAIQEMKKTLSAMSPSLKLEDESTWSKAKNYPYMLHGGMVQYIGHTKFQWDLREKVAPVYSKVWEVDPTELATSFDGFCYMDGHREYSERDLISFVHSDQAPNKNYFWCIQGLINLFDNTEKDGGLVVVPKTHLIHHEHFKKLGKDKLSGDWYKFTDDEKKDPLFKGAIKVCAKKGDFLMWDSRTFHCNTVPLTQNVRACVYICQMPKDKVSFQTRSQRKRAWDDKRCTSHFPGDDSFRMFPVIPKGASQHLRDVIPEVSVKLSNMTDLQKSLLCIK